MSKQGMIDLLTRLAQDRKARQEFKDNPDRVLAGLDLSAEEKAMLERAERDEIQRYLGPDQYSVRFQTRRLWIDED